MFNKTLKLTVPPLADPRLDSMLNIMKIFPACNILTVIVSMLLSSTPIFACTPIAAYSGSSRERGIEMYRRAQAVFVAKIVRVKKVVIRSRNFDMPGEVVVFKINRIFKGNRKPGELYTTKTNLSNGSCGISAVNDPPWWREAPDEKHVKFSRQWIIYSNGDGKSLEALMEGGSALPINLNYEGLDFETLEALFQHELKEKSKSKQSEH